MSVNFTFGCDPEVFVTKNGKGVSAFNLIPGNKKEPHPVERGAVQVDGMALEFNIDPVPMHNVGAWNSHIVKVIQQLKNMVKKTDGSVSFALKPVMDFDKMYLDAQPDEAKELGCDPDYSAYTMEENPRPDGDRPFRTAAGHVHIGWGADIPVDNPEHMEICSNFVKMLDATLGMFMTYIDREPRRRELYGKAGAFRPKPYGVEYRTPSNVWLTNRDRRHLVYVAMQSAIGYMQCGYSPERLFGANITQDKVREIIDTGDYKTAKVVCDVIFKYVPEWYNVKKAFAGVD